MIGDVAADIRAAKVDHERAFLEDVIAHAEDDAPRLVFSDWLEDHGDESRAEFIRVQCQLARIPENDRNRPVLLRREGELLKQNGRTWAAPLRGMVDEWAFRRGFIECVAVQMRSQEGFCSRMDEVFTAFPVRAVRLSCEPSAAVLLMRKRHYLARLVSLDVKELSGVEPEQFMAPLLGREASGLRSLLMECEYSSNDWNDQIGRLACAESLAGLTELGLAFGLYGEPLPSSVLTALVTSRLRAGLRKLHIPFSRFSRPVARLLATAPSLASMTHLDLGCAEVSAPGWRQIISGENISRLRWLGLYAATIAGMDRPFLEEHTLGGQLKSLLGKAADFETSDTFPRWSGQRWT
jgi:uncharacterized protein (TIGR02996 family)